MGSSRVNGGYSATRKSLYAFELRTEDNASMCDFAYAPSRRDACRMVAKPGLRISRVWDEHTMAPTLLEQARDWLRSPH
jgi:hypothetical protein